MTARRVKLYALACALALSSAIAWWCRLPRVEAVSSERAEAVSSETVRFNRDVQPILSDKCFACHGPDANKRQADLRLDVRASALAERDGGRAIVPGDPDHSELVRRTSSTDPDYRMPPPSSNRTLTSREITALAKWVEQGAEYEPHWSFIALRRPPPPSVQDTTWIENPIDRFVLAQLEERGISPSPEADRRTLARRLSFDLVGLPPTPEEVDALVSDGRPAAYDDLVDRLLGSPQYGERMAVYWLDLVRYADTNGYNEDHHRNIYPYRDYVIRAFNEGMPFDQFTVEQLAGDLLPAPTLWQRVASGYNRLNKVSTEFGSQEKEFLAKYSADRVRTTASVWMGATLGCAECHDHKFDPYTSKDFYSFAAFFADIEEEGVPTQSRIAMPPEIAVPGAEDVGAELDGLSRRLAQLRDQRSVALAEDRSAFEQWQRSDPKPSAAIITAQPPFDLDEWSFTGASVSLDGGGQLDLKSPPSNSTNGIERTVRTGTGDIEFLLDISALRFSERASNLVQMLNWNLRQSKSSRGLAVVVHRSFTRAVSLTAKGDEERAIELGTAEEVNSLQLRVLWRAATREWTLSYGVNGALPLKPFPGGPLFDVSVGEATDAWTEAIAAVTFSLDDPSNPASQTAEAPAGLEVLISREVIRRHHPLDDPPAEIAAIRATPPGERSAKQSQTLEGYYLSVAPRFAAWNEQIDELEVKKRALEVSLPHTLVTVATTPRVTRVLRRGDWLDDGGEIVQPAVPAFLAPLAAGAVANRLALARWLVSPDNPLTARVLANRLWKLYFGRGIVRSLEDLGSQGARPSHPELLDWLASELIDSGWNVKHVIRLIVTSRAYRQSSAPRPDLRELDPDNQLYARQSSFRLDAEMVRDNALVVSGLLSRAIGGPSAKPYQPEHYWDGVSKILPGSPAAVWKPSKGQEQYRRGLYTYWKRTFLHPSLLAFDAPSREEGVAERSRSNTPLQALALLNDPTYVEAARVLAERAALHGGVTPEAQLRWIYRQTLSRQPDSETLRVLQALYDKHLREYGADPDSAKLLATVGLAPSQWNGNSNQLAALTSVSRVLLNLNETITRY